MGFVCAIERQEPEGIIVQFESLNCANCTCGRRLFFRSNSPIEVQVPLAVPASKLGSAPLPSLGQSVVLRFGEELFSQTALLLFGLPLLFVFVGAGLSSAAGAGAVVQALFVFLGALVGWYAALSIGPYLQAKAYQSLLLDVETR